MNNCRCAVGYCKETDKLQLLLNKKAKTIKAKIGISPYFFMCSKPQDSSIKNSDAQQT